MSIDREEEEEELASHNGVVISHGLEVVGLLLVGHCAPRLDCRLMRSLLRIATLAGLTGCDAKAPNPISASRLRVTKTCSNNF